ncbi:radical SAM protein [Candidatus Woesearchaeota archaeon]|nr:radical SAM protein [Candidatus Woesearchaeota archaeon]
MKNDKFIDAVCEILNKRNFSKKISFTGFYSLSIFLTYECNFDCMYCFSEPGKNKKTINFSTARAGIDFIVKNSGKKVVKIIFTGGGEPTLKYKLFKKCVDYINFVKKKKNINFDLSIVSNGVWTKEQCNYISKNFQDICISFDGFSDVQNVLRPLKNNKPSYKYVVKTLRSLEKNSFHFGTKTIITRSNINHLDKLIKSNHNNFNPDYQIFDLFYLVGKAKNKTELLPKNEDYMQMIEKLLKNFNNHNLYFRNYFSENLSLRRSHENHLRITLDPENRILFFATTPNPDIFSFGKFNKNKKTFDLDYNSLKKKLSIILNQDECNICPAINNCGLSQKSMKYISDTRLSCAVLQQSFRSYIKKRINHEK